MNFPRTLALALSLLTLSSLAGHAFADVVVTSPASNTTVSSPTAFAASASTSTCSSGVAAMGVYVDNHLTYVSYGTTLNTTVTIPNGTHNTVVEEWDYCGSATFTPVNNLTVTPPASSSTPGIPANAISSGDTNASSDWQWAHDYGTPGTSVGYSSYPVSNLSPDNTARAMNVSYAHRGGEIYHVDFGNDNAATHFVYDTNIYINDPAQVANIEMDVNQVIQNGATVILGTQCSIYSGTWEFVTVKGSSPHWNPSNLPCNPQQWAGKTWHHVQIASHRDQAGNVTYDWVDLDGQVSYFAGAGGNAAMRLGWASGALVLNFQLDGASLNSGSMNVYTDHLMIYRW